MIAALIAVGVTCLALGCLLTLAGLYLAARRAIKRAIR